MAARSKRPAELTASIEEVVAWLFATSPLDGADDTPVDVERGVRLLFLDTLGCMIGGGSKPELQALGRELATFETGPIALPGLSDSLTAPAAAYWAAMAATWDEACEGLARAHGRPGLHAFPVALTLTLAGRGSLGDALVALIRGYELAGRLGERLRIRPGMHVDGTWGTFGAVAAAGSVLGHDAAVVMAAVEAAACQIPSSLYLPVAQGATVRNAYAAEACRRAIGLSLGAAAGMTAPSGGLEVFEELVLDGGRTDVAVAPPGEWLLPEGYLKPYAAVRHVHYGAEAARRWRQQGAPTTVIKTIELDIYPEAVTYCGNRAPRSAIEAQFSLTYGIARMLLTGDLGPDAYTAAALTDSEIGRLERLIVVRPLPGRTPDHRYATLRIVAESGVEHTITVDRVVGDPGNPMSADDVVAKLVAYSSWLPGWPAEAVATAILDGPIDAPLAATIEGGGSSR